MVRLDLFVFGYFKISVEGKDIAKASNILLRAGIGAKIDSHGVFLISYRKRARIEKLFLGKVDYRISNPCGIVGFFLKNKYRFGVYLAFLFVSILFAIGSDTVWDVRVEGVEQGEEAEITEHLCRAGLSIGKRWSKIDKSQIEINALCSSDLIGWINVNRRGTVAYVSVGRKILYDEEQVPSGYASIVAARDCVIEEIIVESGYPTVKKGESVRAGQVLISGIIPQELGGGFCYAKGSVKGRYADSVSVSAERKIEVKSSDEPFLSRADIIFFGKELNIFKNYRQSVQEYDIIEKTEEITLGKRLPIAIRKTYLQPYQHTYVTLGDEQLVSSCAQSFKEEINRFLSDKEAKSMSVSAEFYDGGYRMRCDMIVCAEVTKIQEFKVE